MPIWLRPLIGITMAGIASAVLLGAVGCRIPRGKKEPEGPSFVRVEKIDGTWWFVHRDKRFVALGVNVVQPEDSSKPKDGRSYSVLAKYDGDRERWAQDALARLETWGFNTVAAWSDPMLYDRFPIYHTRVVWMGPWGSHDSRLIDVFSPEYADALDRTARKEIAPHATNEYLIGYFLNNELPWYGERGWPTGSDVSLLTRYMRLPPLAPGKQKAVAFLRQRYNERFEDFAANWETSAASFDELTDVRAIRPRRRQAQKDVIAWAGEVAEQYFKLCYETMRRYDTNHMFLGVRFVERAFEPVMIACAKYADVVSINYYRKTGVIDPERLNAIAALTGKPLMITEFSWRAMENSSGCPNTVGADVTVQTQADRAARYRQYVTSVLQLPFVVGCDWFMYHDQPPAGRFDGENSNYGLVDIYDNPYTTLVEAMAQVNRQAEAIHAAPTPAEPVAYNPAVLADYREVVIAASDKTLSNPVLFADGSCEYFVWGDSAKGSRLDVAPVAGNALRLNFSPSGGWGCGITFKPRRDLSVHPDGSADLSGARRVRLTLEASAGVRFSVGIQESGHGPTDAQTFDGFAGADGESYAHRETVTSQGRQTYIFTLDQMEPQYAYGNQRGNFRIDTPAIAQCHVFFPGGQPNATLTFLSIEFD